MLINELPIEICPLGFPGAVREIRHFAEVVATGDVGFGAHEAAIGKLAHAIDVGDHDPVVGVDVHFHEPLVNVIGISTCEEEVVAQDHESFDVVVVGVTQGFGDHGIKGWDAGGGGVKAGRQGMGEFPKVGGALASADGEVDVTDEFSPADDLADKPFEAVEGDLVSEGQGFIDDFLWTEQADVDEGR